MDVRKSNGSFEEYDREKIRNGICNAYHGVGEECNDAIINAIIGELFIYEKISTSEIRRQVEDALMSINKKVAKKYIETNCDAMELKKRADFIESYIDASNASSGSKYDSNANVSNKKYIITLIPALFYVFITTSFIFNQKIGFNLPLFWSNSIGILATLIVFAYLYKRMRK